MSDRLLCMSGPMWCLGRVLSAKYYVRFVL